MDAVVSRALSDYSRYTGVEHVNKDKFLNRQLSMEIVATLKLEDGQVLET